MPECQEIDGLIEPAQVAAEFSPTQEIEGLIEPEQVAAEIEVCP